MTQLLYHSFLCEEFVRIKWGTVVTSISSFESCALVARPLKRSEAEGDLLRS